jgi:hypothetical protein
MSQGDELNRIRELFLQAPESRTTGILAIVLSTLVLVTVLVLVRQRKLREEYTPIWVVLALLMTAVSLRLDLLRLVTRAIGAWTPSSTLFFLGELFLMGICLNYAVRFSRQSSTRRPTPRAASRLSSRVHR